jgi:hypothetical protein
MKGMIDTSISRHWFMHTPHAVIGMGGNVQIRPAAPIRQPEPAHVFPLHVGILAGGDATWDTAAENLAAGLDSDLTLKSDRAWETVAADDDVVDDYDCLVLLGWPDALDRRRLKQIELYCRCGGPLVALRTLHAEMPDWPDFAEDVFGARQPAAPRPRLMEVQRSDVAWHHPVLEGVENLIAEGEVYRGPRLAPATTVLLTANDGRGSAPVAWVTRHAGGRVFCSTLGHDDDFRQPAFLRLIANALHWAAPSRL